MPLEPSAAPIRFDEIVSGRPGPETARHFARETSGSGVAAVWARSNTREALWDALSRKEVYATTGTRLRVQVFAGYDFMPADVTTFPSATGSPPSPSVRKLTTVR